MPTPNWKLQLKFEDSPVPKPPRTAAFLKRWPKYMDQYGTWTIKNKNPADKVQPKIKQVHCFLQSHAEIADNRTTVNNPAVYAIIGCGFSATINRVSLSKSARYAKQLIHIGYPDPWSGYVKHNMNQAVELLTLPGYLYQPTIDESYVDSQPQQRWLASTIFADRTKKERERFQKERYFSQGVTSISKEGDHFQIILNDDNKTIIKAKCVDILTGVGQQRVLKPPTRPDDDYGLQMSKALWKEYLMPEKMDEDWSPRVVSAEMYVRGSCKPKANGDFCITGASPASIQAMEHALLHDGEGNSPENPGDGAMQGGVMVNSGKCNDGFLPIGRLDYHAQTVTGEPLPMPRLNAPSGDICPSINGVWFGEGYRIKSIEEYVDRHRDYFTDIDDLQHAQHKSEGKLLVTFRENKRHAQRRLVDKDNTDGGSLKYGLFDQVILSTGRLRGREEVGSALGLVADFEKQLQPISSENGFHVGLQCPNNQGQLRILGGAGINNPIFTGYNNYAAFSKYEASLPIHARVNGEGVTLAGHTVAWANEFYTVDERDKSVLNTNINTATLKELEAVCKSGTGLNSTDAKKLAIMIYQARRRRIGPFISTSQTLILLEIFNSFTIYRGNEARDVKGAKELKNNFVRTRQTLRQLRTHQKQNKVQLETNADRQKEIKQTIAEHRNSGSMEDQILILEQEAQDISEQTIEVEKKKLETKLRDLKLRKEKVETQISDDMAAGTLQIMNNDALVFAYEYSETIPSNQHDDIKDKLPACIQENWRALTTNQRNAIKKLTFKPKYYLQRKNGDPKEITK